MARTYIFADESGCLTFKRNEAVSKYFVVCTISMKQCDVGGGLVDLRREMIWEGLPIGDCFHASSDKQAVRNRVFDTLTKYDFQIQATIMEKSKAQPHIRETEPIFYKYGWYYHFRDTLANFGKTDEVLITAEAIGKRKVKARFKIAANNVLQQLISRDQWAANFCGSVADACLQAVDYCSWAIHRKWERGDERSYERISDRITREYDLWARGKKHYY